MFLQLISYIYIYLPSFHCPRVFLQLLKAEHARTVMRVGVWTGKLADSCFSPLQLPTFYLFLCCRHVLFSQERGFEKTRKKTSRKQNNFTKSTI